MFDSPLFLRLSPAFFVFLWSSGWIVAGYSARYSDALTFLSVRFACAGLALSILAVALGAQWPKTWRATIDCAVAGILLHAIYLGGVWWAVRHGLPAGVSGLIAGLQPVLTALFAPLIMRESISPIRWLGIVFGFVGIALVLEPKLVGVAPEALSAIALPIIVNVVGMFAVTFGSFWQKARIVEGDLRTVTAVQYIAAFLFTLPFAYFLEPMRIEWNLTMGLVLAWSVLALSLGGIGLYLVLIRRGQVSRIATFLYLVPPAVAVEAWILFGETLTVIQLVGMAVAVLGVVLASRK